MRIPALIVACITTLAAHAQQPVPDAPQPQKKQVSKAPDPPPPAKDDNAFPEEVSKQAAEAATKVQAPKTSDDNPFPEAESKAAAKAAGEETAPPPPPVHDPARSNKDNEVGSFYLKAGDYQAALLRYQDATAADPTNVNAIFGLAESQRLLKRNADAARNYQLYLAILPDGPKAKQAVKALKALAAAK